jgi:hypothetical protein
MRARRFENSVAESDKQNDKPKTKDNLKLKTLLTTAAMLSMPAHAQGGKQQ